MKRLMLIAVALIVSSMVADLSAQQLVKKRIGTYNENGVTIVSEVSTIIAVDLVVECEKFVAGPYARYAQKYFGTRALQVDKLEWRVAGAELSISDIALSSGDVVAEQGVKQCGFMGDAESYAVVLPNRLSSEELSNEDAAEDAAEQLFALRRARLDLVTGELGDGVYGAGLESALREIDRMEREYLELFYGKSSVTTEVKRIYVPINSENTGYVIARFNSKDGLLAVDDLKGEVVMLTVSPSEMNYPEDMKNGKGKLVFRYANNAGVTLSVAHRVVNSCVLPIYEFGEIITY